MKHPCKMKACAKKFPRPQKKLILLTKLKNYKYATPIENLLAENFHYAEIKTPAPNVEENSPAVTIENFQLSFHNSNTTLENFQQSFPRLQLFLKIYLRGKD